VSVVAPAPDRPIRLDGQAVVGSAGYGDYAAKPRDLHRHIAARVRAIAQLAVSVVAPAPDRPIRLDGQAVVCSGGYGDYAAKPRDLHRHIAVRVRAIAQLAVEVVAAAPGRPTGRLPLRGCWGGEKYKPRDRRASRRDPGFRKHFAFHPGLVFSCEGSST